jgi:hypothetical protein
LHPDIEAKGISVTREVLLVMRREVGPIAIRARRVACQQGTIINEGKS